MRKQRQNVSMRCIKERNSAPLLLLILVLVFLPACATSRSALPWQKAKDPSPGVPDSIGSYAAGCIQGAESIDPQGPGFLLMRYSRNRHYGHPNLIEFIRKTSKDYYDWSRELLLIGDLGQPRGGPMPTGHKSHQIGLDVDVWLETLADNGKGLSMEDREKRNAKLVADYDKEKVDKKIWRPQTVFLLHMIAENENVDRIFLNPVLKRELCLQFATQPPEKRNWLAKIRPWFGHDRHFHVRLKCPLESADCVNQKALEDELQSPDGCDQTLNWWFSEEAKQMTRDQEGEPPIRELPRLPNRCDKIIPREEPLPSTASPSSS